MHNTHSGGTISKTVHFTAPKIFPMFGIRLEVYCANNTVKLLFSLSYINNEVKYVQTGK